MAKFKCVFCRGEDDVHTLETMEFEIDNKLIVVEKIPVVKCTKCGELFFDKQANEYIDLIIKIFRADGIENRIKELAKQKGLTQKKIGELLGGLTKQRISQIYNADSIDIKLAYKLADIIEEPIEDLFKKHKIIQRDNKYYIN
ncbi:YgiT-type zinc finger domain-containing protein [Fontibacillus solani]|uniref:YgiT-type zinc finger domain-containing protein n=1 Tax=Fontibacillus solani TaxID=1572857 RepID=A0A7W3SUW0_9BACL|nr:YgiT-type zinc finger protein [Fontibacillus solani]MBA9086575.1 YgiT-type zinc finger domain-containing protein [Fontibacillus solani]